MFFIRLLLGRRISIRLNDAFHRVLYSLDGETIPEGILEDMTVHCIESYRVCSRREILWLQTLFHMRSRMAVL